MVTGQQDRLLKTVNLNLATPSVLIYTAYPGCRLLCYSSTWINFVVPCTFLVLSTINTVCRRECGNTFVPVRTWCVRVRKEGLRVLERGGEKRLRTQDPATACKL